MNLSPVTPLSPFILSYTLATILTAGLYKYVPFILVKK